MKKILSLGMVLALCLTVLATAAFADGGLSVSADKSTAAPGDTVTFTVSLSGAPALGVLEIPISYDDAVLELVASEASGSGWTIGTSAVWLMTDAGEDLNGTLFTLTFQVKDDAEIGATASVSVSVESAAQDDETAVSISGSSASVTIAEAEVEPTPEPTPEPTERPAVTTGHVLATASDNHDGTHTGVCIDCGETVTMEHTWNDGTVIKEATATEEGEMQLTCTICGETVTRTIAKTTGTVTPTETTAPEEPTTPAETEAPAETETPAETEAPAETTTPVATTAPVATAAPSSNGGSSSTGRDSVPKTGDETPIALYIALAFVCAAGLGVAVVAMRKKEK